MLGCSSQGLVISVRWVWLTRCSEGGEGLENILRLWVRGSGQWLEQVAECLAGMGERFNRVAS